MTIACRFTLPILEISEVFCRKKGFACEQKKVGMLEELEGRSYVGDALARSS
jgi:hypothetical protein